MALSLIPAKERRNLGCLEKGGRSASDVKPGDPQKREKLGLLQTFSLYSQPFYPPPLSVSSPSPSKAHATSKEARCARWLRVSKAQCAGAWDVRRLSLLPFWRNGFGSFLAGHDKAEEGHCQWATFRECIVAHLGQAQEQPQDCESRDSELASILTFLFDCLLSDGNFFSC